MKKNESGFTLVELIIFIVVLGIAVTAVFSTFSVALQQSPTASVQTTVIELAQARMELILGQRRLKGFSSFADPCPAAAPCTLPAALSAYSVSETITATTINGDSAFDIISVTATGPSSAKANVQTLVAYY